MFDGLAEGFSPRAAKDPHGNKHHDDSDVRRVDSEQHHKHTNDQEPRQEFG